MADKNPIEADLAAKVHRAECDFGQANAAPAGANRIDKINATAEALRKAEEAYDRCLAGVAYPVR